MLDDGQHVSEAAEPGEATEPGASARQARWDARVVRLIVAYKLAKGVGAMVFALVVVLIGVTSVAAEVRSLAADLVRHAGAAWSVALAEWVLRSATARHVGVLVLAASLDGALSAVEGWALHKRYAWSGWLIVAATSCLLPFEVLALARHPSVMRGVVLAVNAAVVGFLLLHRSAVRARGR